MKKLHKEKRETLIVFADKTVKVIKAYSIKNGNMLIKVSDNLDYPKRQLFKSHGRKFRAWKLVLPCNIIGSSPYRTNLEGNNFMAHPKTVLNATSYLSNGCPMRNVE